VRRHDDDDEAERHATGLPPHAARHRCHDASHLPHVAPGRLSDARLLEAVAEVETAVAALHARQMELLAEFSRRGADAREYAADELAARLAWTAFTAQRRLDDAEALTERLPNTLALLGAGLLDLPRARTVVTGTTELDDDCAAAVDEAIAAVAPDLTTTKLTRRVALEALAVDPQAAANRAKTARRGRRVTARPLGDGCARLVADGPAEDIATLLAGLTRACRTATPGDDRGIDTRRFDSLTAFGQHLLDGGALPGHGSGDPVSHEAATAPGDPAAQPGALTPGAGSRPGRVRPAVLVTMTLPALLGLREDPAQLDGYGPLPASVAREIAENARLRRLLTDEFTGIAIGLDGHDYPGFRLDPNRDGPGDEDPDERPDDPHGDGPGNGPVPGQPPSGTRSTGRPPPSTGPPDRRSSTTSGARTHPPAPPPPAPPPPPQEPASVPAAIANPRCPVAVAGGGGYRPRPLLDKLIRLRDQTCRLPGCSHPARTADVDHTVAHPTGPTCPCNLHVLCRRHHQMKQTPGITIERHRDGTSTWTLPTGHSYSSGPESALATARVIPASASRRSLPGFPSPGALSDGRAGQGYPRYDSTARDLERLRGPEPPDYGPPPF